MATHFQPSPERAAAVNLAMAQSLRHSLFQQLQALQALPATLTNGLPSEHHLSEPLPLDYLAWFNLLSIQSGQTAPQHLSPAQVTHRAADALLRITTAVAVTPAAAPSHRIITLAPPYYRADDLASLLHWWDTEPDNAMDLQAVTAAEITAAEPLIAHALHTLQQAAPDLFHEWQTLIREVVLAKPGNQHRLNFNGVSSFAAWGAIGVNLPAHTHWAHFLKTLVHEAGHLMLFGIARTQPLLTNDPTERRSSPLRFDPRPMDGIFHAAYVSAREAYAFDACLNWLETTPGQSDPDAATQLENQLEHSVLAFWDCCDQLQQHAHLTELGHAVLRDCQQYMSAAFEVQAD